MPYYKTHLVGGFVTFTLVASVCSYQLSSLYGYNIIMLMWFLCCSLAGSLFPDIDTKSKGQLLTYRIASLGLITCIVTRYWMMLSLVSLLLIVPLLVHHRGITHQAWFVICVPFFAPLITAHHYPTYTTTAFLSYLFFVAGAFSHLFLDFGPRSFFRRGLFATSSKPKQRYKRQEYIWSRTKNK